jgi:hypothetical protein
MLSAKSGRLIVGCKFLLSLAITFLNETAGNIIKRYSKNESNASRILIIVQN